VIFVDPISISVELELGALLLAAVGAVATWLNHRHQKAMRRQRERHHQEMRAFQERQHRAQMAALHVGEEILEDVADTTLPVQKPPRRTTARPAQRAPRRQTR
jgi:hypothetical protein